MNPTSSINQDSELILRRLEGTFPDWVLLFPVLFAFVVLFLILFFIQRESVGEMFKRVGLPPVVTGTLGLLWSLGLLAFLGLLGLCMLFELALSPVVVVTCTALLVGFPLLLGLFISAMICIRHPLTLLSVGGVVVVSALYLVFGFFFKPVFGWWVILTPFLLLALFYVFMMYIRDAQTIHPLWAAFLGLLRCTVYGILAAVFLLPGCQTYDTTETHPKVLVLFDVSGSMGFVDDLPQPGQDPKTLPSRQAKVIDFLTAVSPEHPQTFMERIQTKSPATVYAFGGVLDEVHVENFLNGRKWDKGQWQAFLMPDGEKINVPEMIGGRKLSEKERNELRQKLFDLHKDVVGGTNISGSALQAAVRESGSIIQAIIIVSDGRSNLGSNETLRELRARANNQKRPIHIITVGVGEYRQPVGIRIGNLEAPQTARPDDKFPVRVPVYGEGLDNESVTVALEAIRMMEKGKGLVPIPGDRFTLTKESKFKAAEVPFTEVEFLIDVRALKGIKSGDETKDDQVLGTWEFKAKVARHHLEAFPDAEHVSKPERVKVQKQPLRVLLFAGGPTRDYQFVRTLFYREVQESRMELSVFLQTAGEKDVDQDVKSERLLTHFPDRLGGESKDPYSNLSNYDVIVAFDPDWVKLDPEQLKLVKQWVGGPSAGGLITVAGPVYTYELARPGGMDLSALLSIFPVVLKDSRLHGLGIGHDAARPYALNFPENAKQYDFLKVDEETETPLGGWDRFFWGDGPKPEPGKDVRPQRGIYNYYPVDKVKPASVVVATFAGPTSSRINDGKDEQPYLVFMPYGAGKSVYLSSAEMWRLRMFKSSYHERFWIKLARFAASGNQNKLSRYGRIVMRSRANTGVVPLEAQLLGSDLLPMSRDARPVVQVTPPPTFDRKTDRETPDSFELKARNKEGEWQGWFSGKFRVRTRGDYILSIQIPGTTQTLTHQLTVDDPDLEKSVTRPDLGHLYQLATSARNVLARLDEKKRAELVRVLRPPVGPDQKEQQPEGEKIHKDEVRLYFPLQSASLIPDCLINMPSDKTSTKGRLQDLWDLGTDFGGSVGVHVIAMLVLGALGLLVCVSTLFGGRWLVALLVLAGTVLTVGGIVFLDLLFEPSWPQVSLALRADAFIVLLLGAVGLLAFAILGFTQRWLAALGALAAAGLVVFLLLGVNLVFDPPWALLPLNMSFVLGVVVGLLSIEWLTRKLLKLA